MIAAVLLVGACSAGGSSGPEDGHAIQGDGLSGQGVSTVPNARVGDTFEFALPMFRNTTDQPVVVDSVRVADVPAGVQVVGYPIYSLADTDGIVLTYKDGSGFAPDLTKIRNYTGKPIQIAKQTTSDHYATVALKITKQVSNVSVSGCQVNYTQGGQKYTQTLTCKFVISAH